MRSTVEAYFTAVSANDATQLGRLLTDDLRWRVPQGAIEPYAGLHEGAQEIIQMMLGAVEHSFVPGSQETEILTTLYGEDLTCVETEMRATTPDGRQYRNDYTFFFEFRDGRISEIREHVDTRYAAEFFS